MSELLETSESHNLVYIKNTNTDEVRRAFVDEDGIVRDSDDRPYGNMYEIVEVSK